MKRQAIALPLLLLVLVMTGCFTQIDNSAEVVLAQVLADLVSFTDILQSSLGEILNDETTTSSLNSATLSPQYARKVKFTRGKLSREVISDDDIFVNDQLGTATVKVQVAIPGKVELFDSEANLLGEKDASLAGTCTYTLEQSGKSWQITQRQIDLATPASSIQIQEPIIDPDPVATGGSFTVEVDIHANAEIRAIARNRHVYRHLVYHTDEDYYKTAQPVTIAEDAKAGIHPAIIKAVAWGSLRDETIDPATGDFTAPVQITMKSFFVEVK